MSQDRLLGGGKIFLALLVSLELVVACGSDPDSPQPQAAGSDNGMFVFTLTSERETRTDEVATADGTARHVNLIARCRYYSCHHKAGDWSPDGSKLVYVNECGDCESKLVVVSPDGSTARTIHKGILASPAWSPDGTRIAFVDYSWPRSAEDWTSDIYVIDSNGDHLTRVTRTPRVAEEELDWSSRNLLVFRSSRDRWDWRSYELFTSKPDGRGLRQITHNQTPDRQPDWAPDGKTLTFVRGRGRTPPAWKPPGPDGEIWTADATGSDGAKLGWGHSPAWAPDGTVIAFVAGNALHTVSPLGGKSTAIGKPVDEGTIDDLDWQPR